MKNLHNNVFSFIFGLCFCCISTTVYADSWKMEGKVGALFPDSRRIRKIFHTLSYVEVEGSYRFPSSWDVWGGVGYIFSCGDSLGCGNKTSIQVIPLSLGVRRFISITPNLDFFIGVGGLWSVFYNRDHSSYLHKNNNSQGFGGVFKSGLQYQFNDRIIFSSSLEYMYQRFSFERTYKKHFTYRNDVNMSGLKLSLGIAYKF